MFLFWIFTATIWIIPTSGKFSEWNTWSSCSSACHAGKSTRERILKPHGGDACYSAIIKERDCYGTQCPRTSNLAAGKTATASSNLFNLYPAKLAVDGNKHNLLNQKSCMHTEKDQDPWLRIDLQASKAVQRVVIYNRFDCCGDRLNNLYVTVGDNYEGIGNTVCGRLGDVADVSIPKITCSDELVGRYVHLRIPGPQFLHVCEVEVFGAAIKDLSRGRGTILSSTVGGNHASRAIDNNRGTMVLTKQQKNPFFRIDFGTELKVYKVRIFSDNVHPFNTTAVTVGNNPNGILNSACGITEGKGPFGSAILECKTILKGRFVQLTQFGVNQLGFSEIYIDGY